MLSNNSLRRLSSSTDQEAKKRQRTRLEYGYFDLKTQCFYCGKPCVFDLKHPDRKRFEEVGTNLHRTTNS